MEPVKELTKYDYTGQPQKSSAGRGESTGAGLESEESAKTLVEMIGLVEKLAVESDLEDNALLKLLDYLDGQPKAAAVRAHLIEKAHQKRMEIYGNRVFLRGLIEVSNFCKRNCVYCGIRAGNPKADRYRLTADQVLESCRIGYDLGYRTFVMQGGEDPLHTDDFLTALIREIRERFPDCAITLSLGERSRESYQALFDAGADRYLLRHESAEVNYYQRFHPGMTLADRKQCLEDLKDIGYQVGAGFMVGLPGQSNQLLVQDLRFLKTLDPHMIGIGPFIPHHETPLSDQTSGCVDKTVVLLAIIRLLIPKVLLPATTALGSLDPSGRELGIRAGANVIMPNLSPMDVRKKYDLYDGKLSTGEEAAESRRNIERRIEDAGFAVDMARGDHPDWRNKNVY
ncbi:[FeFe] hydrogenase H-cluster radical SAM maturase HydE [Acidaminobacter hydrogenoformans]|uniref:[FeFe] hydrogenase H-cluster radical SAM maturase HydE n=1 Tax=Acidaminobacter hydrogenoformans TaxID=65403 RepID=UPI001FA6ACFD|nr:[FeFe] hydrogenase H-cluster radical SAM maturase HydE [Acidaminobacter hydrogenoformans]